MNLPSENIRMVTDVYLRNKWRGVALLSLRTPKRLVQAACPTVLPEKLPIKHGAITQQGWIKASQHSKFGDRIKQYRFEY
jgi:hypothetical protein